MQQKPLIYAHRGASEYYPENSMLSFQGAIKMGADGIELDVQLSHDGEVVVIHDELVNRTSNHQGYVKDFSYSKLLKMDFSAGFLEYENISIPTLDEVLELAASSKLQVNIELKNSKIRYAGLEEKVLGIIKNHKIEERIQLSSFNHISMVKVKSLNPDIQTALLYACIIHEPFNYAKSCGADGIHPHYMAIDQKTVSHCRQQGIAVRVWTVDDAPVIKNLAALGVDAIITNCPDIAMEAIP